MALELQNYSYGALTTPDQRQMGLFLHLSQLANIILFPVGIIIPIVLWQTQKEKIPQLDAHGKMVANWMISSMIYAFICIPLIFLFLLGVLLLMILAVVGIVFPIIGGIKANNGELWEYPLTIRFLK